MGASSARQFGFGRTGPCRRRAASVPPPAQANRPRTTTSPEANKRAQVVWLEYTRRQLVYGFSLSPTAAPAPRSAEGRLLADLRSIVRRLGQGAARSLLSNTADRFRERVRRRRGHEAELPLFGERKSSRACGRRRAGRDDDRRDSELFEQTITITNTTGQVLRGPMALVLKGLPDGVTLANAGGAYQGNPYVNVLGDGRALAPGQSVIITLEFLVGGRHRKDGDDFSYGLDALLGI